MNINISDNGALGDILKNWFAGWSKRKGDQMELAELKTFVPELLDFLEFLSKEVKRRKLSPATVDFLSKVLGVPIEAPVPAKAQLTAAVEDVISKMSLSFDGGVVEMPK